MIQDGFELNLLDTYAGARASCERYEILIYFGACTGEVGAYPAVWIEFEGVLVVERRHVDEVACHTYGSLLYSRLALEQQSAAISLTLGGISQPL